MKNETNSGTTLIYRLGFWTALMAAAAIAVVVGPLALLLCLYMLVSGLWTETPSSFLTVFAISGASLFLIGLFCSKLPFKWARLLRYCRYQEERAETMIAARDVNEYAENEVKRNRELFTTIEMNNSELSRMMKDRLEEDRVSTQRSISSITKQMNMLTESVRAMSSSLDSIKSKITGEIIAAAPSDPETPKIIRAEEDASSSEATTVSDMQSAGGKETKKKNKATARKKEAPAEDEIPDDPLVEIRNQDRNSANAVYDKVADPLDSWQETAETPYGADDVIF